LNKRIYFKIFIILLIFSFASLSSYAEPYQSFTYSFGWGAVPSPAPYLPIDLINIDSSGIKLVEPKDLFVDNKGNFYIANTGNNSIVYISADKSIIKEIKEFNDKNGLYELFKRPEGVFVSNNGDIYIADTGSKRIVKFNSQFVCQDIIRMNQSDVLGENYDYLPSKVVVDDADRIYAISKNDYQGILEISQNSDFVGYTGSNTVNPNPIELMWKKLMTKEQRNKMAQFIPYEFSNLSLDNEGFIFAVSASGSESKPIKRFNPSGQDILIRQTYTTPTNTIRSANSFFVDVCSHENGNYSAIDYKSGKIFVYNNDGYLLYAFGGLGNLRGNFSNPIALCSFRDNLYVLDMTNRTITVFGMTEYAKKISEAEYYYDDGQYDKSAEMWQDVLKENANLELAYTQIGKVYLRQGKDSEAMKYFKLGNFRGDASTKIGGFNDAFTQFRKIFIRENILYIFIGIITLLAIRFLYYIMVKKKSKRKNK
jgi:hypothetical protein